MRPAPLGPSEPPPTPWLLFAVLVLLIMAALAGCPRVAGPCTPGATRCADLDGGTARETCGSDGRWRLSLDCREASRNGGAFFVCQPAEGGGSTCLPATGDGWEP